MVARKDLSPEEELLLLEQGIETPFWQYMQSWLGEKGMTIIGAALSEKVENRDWMAGKANGLKEALKYPADRIRALKSQAKKAV